jgi:hypothetical protein
MTKGTPQEAASEKIEPNHGERNWPLVLTSVAAMAAGATGGFFAILAAGFGPPLSNYPALYGLSWCLGWGSIGGTLGAIIARLCGGTVGRWGAYVAGTALGFVSWETVAYLMNLGMWSSRKDSPPGLPLVASFALMLLGILLASILRKLLRT